MKRKNFPARKNARRIRAKQGLERDILALKKYIASLTGKDNTEEHLKKVRKDLDSKIKQLEVLEERIVPLSVARQRKTKINRSR